MYGISADGLIVVGRNTSASSREPYASTRGGGMVGLGDLAGGGFLSGATDVSGDGSVIVGFGGTGLGFDAFRWTSATGVVSLGGGLAEDASGDGSLVVGYSGSDATIWDARNGMRPLDQVLTDFGLDLTGWTLSDAWAITPDGRVIAGDGTNPDGQPESWIAVLSDPPPDPPTLPSMGPLATLLLTSLLGLASWRLLRA